MNKLNFLKVIKFVKSGLLSALSDYFWTFLPQTVKFRTKVFSFKYYQDFWVQNQTIFCPFSQNSHISDSPKKNDNFGNYLETLVILTFSRNYRLFNPSSTFSRHFLPFLWNTEFWVQKQTNFGPFIFEKSDFKQESKIFRLFGTTGKGPWFQSYFSTFHGVINSYIIRFYSKQIEFPKRM